MRKKSQIEEYIKYGLMGNPEIKKDEKDIFLGEFMERVVLALNFEQAMEREKVEKMKKMAAQDIVEKIIVNARMNNETRMEYMKVAKEYKKDFKLVDSKSELAVVLGSKEANDIEDIFI